MRMMLGILAVLGVLVIGFGVALAAGWVRFGNVDPFANIKVNPATQPVAGPETQVEEPIPEPPPLVDKTILLRPEDARLGGRSPRLTEYTQTTYGRFERKQITTHVITGFNSPEDTADWMLRVSKPGKYTVSFDYAATGAWGKKGPEAIVGGFELRAGEKVLVGEIKSTRSSRAFELVDMGTLELPQGDVRITLRPTGKTSLPLMSLRGIRLFPPD